jgi:ABC-type transport system involved in cytochrome c biogenesis ATPase subunit
MPTVNPPLLQVQDLAFAHPGRPVFKGLQAELPAGLGLVCGDEGRGKSTLLELLAGRLMPAQGRLLLRGRALQPQDVAWFDPQDPARDARVVSELLDELAGPQDLPGLLQGLGLEPHLPKPLYQLSAGSRRKVFIAAALSLGLPLTLLDQPFRALDRPSVNFLCGHFVQWCSQADRLLLIADYLAPEGLPLTATLDLDRLG